MPRLIDVDVLGIGKCNPDVFANKGYASGWNAAIDLINAAPTIDAVPVVRCRECRYFCKGENDAESWEWCDAWKKDCWSDCYCAIGQRREDGDGDGYFD